MSHSAPPQQSAPPQPPAPRPDPSSGTPEEQLERYRRVRTPLLWLTGVLLLTYLSSSLVLPWKGLALLLAAIGIGLGVLVIARSGRIASKWVVRASAVFAMLGCAMFALVVTAQMVFWNATAEHESCMAGALTDRARVACENAYFSELGVSSPAESGATSAPSPEPPTSPGD